MKILFVCTGNVCRSAFAEKLANQLKEKYGLSHFSFDSAGTGALQNKGSDPSMLEVAKEFGVNLAAHRGKQLKRELIQKFDVILLMDRGHQDFINSFFGEFSESCYLFTEYPKKSFWKAKDIPDPYRQSPEMYRKSLKKIEKLIFHQMEYWSL
jgi:protein-tyrosine phosphatase